ncbi:hypothetical protein BCT86_13050 [Vibrio breoganii]|uniref:restriction endonuclease subunit S n=1 Tax=Vibrio breoganii TaxID=553239 RepID=UPI000C816DC3|nr:restriction endonuclease subunit S [Vibrio breoganii]PML05257.1 hypothetical protein BCT86_13050 [Vibrio breoganii]
MTEQMNVPKLRFREFENFEIQSERLGTLVTMKSGNTPSKNNAEFWEGTIPWISASSMRGNVYSESENNVTQLALENGAKVASKGSLLLLVRGSMLYNKIPVGFAGRDVTFNQDVKAVNLKNGDDNSYLFHWFKASEHKLLNMVTGTGIGAGKLDTEELLSLPFVQPTLSEQQKIASFLSKVDEKIGLLTEKKDKLTEYKKGVMQQLFNGKWGYVDGEDEGQVTFIPPTLRFKADDGSEFPDWEEKKLGEVVSTQKYAFTGGPFGSDLKSEDYTETGVRIIQLQNIGDGYFNNDYKIYTSSAKADSLKSCNIYPGDLLLSKMGDPVARALLVPDTEERYVMCSDGIRIVPDVSRFNSYFLMSYINSPFFRNRAFSVSTGSTRQRIGLTDLKSLPLIAPNITEQTKIANFLSAIDQKIDLTSSELEKAKEWKKGLLQQMFV